MGSLRHERGLTYDVRGGVHVFRDGGYLELRTQVANSRVDEALRAMLTEIGRARRDVYSTEALAVARAKVLATNLFPPRNRDLARTLAPLAAAGMDAADIEQLAARTRSLTPEQLRRTARRLLSPERVSALLMGDYYQYSNSITRLGRVRRVAIRGMDE